jgi:hypothetical protein
VHTTLLMTLTVYLFLAMYVGTCHGWATRVPWLSVTFVRGLFRGRAARSARA